MGPNRLRSAALMSSGCQPARFDVTNGLLGLLRVFGQDNRIFVGSKLFFVAPSDFPISALRSNFSLPGYMDFSGE
jgi:hypothetical protein